MLPFRLFSGYGEVCVGVVRCPNPTCKGPLQHFRALTAAEIPAVRALMGKYPAERGEKFRPQAYHRCTGAGCRRVQRIDNWQLGGNLPEGF